jgi:AraC-like DNA-binding protein
MTGTVSRVVLQAALDALARRERDPAPVIRQSGLSAELLASADARIPFVNAVALWEEAARAVDDASFGLRVACEIPDGYGGVLEYLLCTSATLSSGYQRLSQFIRIGYDESDLRVHEEPLQVRLTRSASGSRQYDEFLLGYLMTRGRRACGVDWTPRAAAFGHAAPADRALLEAIFRCPLAFGARQNELRFDREVGQVPLLKTDLPLQAVLIDYARSLIARQPAQGDLQGRLSAAILAEMPRQLPTTASVARALKIEPRSLQRQLEKQGTTFARVREEHRRQLALRYLEDASLSIGEIAFLLQFAEIAPFDRAFKRWMGTSPSAYRARLWTKPAPAPQR